MDENIILSKSKIVRNQIYWCTCCNHIEKIMELTDKVDVELYSSDPLDKINLELIDPISINNGDVHIFCNNCKKEMVQIDNELFHPILKLNAIGYKTEFCCSGHRNIDRVYILFAPDIKLPSIPKGWKMDNRFRTIYVNVLNPTSYVDFARPYIEPDLDSDVPSYRFFIDNLVEWVDELTPIKTISEVPEENEVIYRVDYCTTDDTESSVETL